MDSENIIEVHNLCKTFRKASVPAVNELTLVVKRGEIFGLLGPNGAGKTTTISMLVGLFAPSSGTAKVAGLNLHNDLMKIKGIIGVVPQDVALYPTLTGRENLNFFGNMYGLKGKDLRDRIDFWLSKFGLKEAANKRVSTYSGGMKRRLNLIAGVLHRPQILFLDEPTVGVDVQSRNVIIEELKELNQQGMTIVYTSHHMDEAQHFCTHVAIIDYGKIISEGSPSQLIAAHEGCQRLEDVFLHLTKRSLRD